MYINYINFPTANALAGSLVPNCTTTLSFSFSQVRKTTVPSDKSKKSTVPNTSKIKME